MKSIISIILFELVTLILPAAAQETITTKPEVLKRTSITFTDEWQFLTSDIYLFNENKFNTLINSLGKKPKTNFWGKIVSEKIEFLTLTATVKDVEFFNKQPMVYPLYNFKIGYNKKTKYKTHDVTESPVIRLINNMPLSSSQGFIDMELAGEAITDTDGNKIIRIVSAQLSNISKITNPTEAVLGFIGELGSFLGAAASKSQYRFSSTIRLYDDSQFKKKVHSINVYSLKPSSKSDKDDFSVNKTNVEGFVAKIKFEDDVEINKQVLRQLIPYDGYPFFVIVNFMSKYDLPYPIDVTSEYVKEYTDNVNMDCEKGTKPVSFCTQGRELVEFYNLYILFKSHQQLYDLSVANDIKSDLNKNLFLLMQDYYRLLLMKESRDTEYKGVTTYTNVFSPNYVHVLTTVERSLKETMSLNQVRSVTKVLFELKEKDLSSLKSQNIENYLATLYSLDLPTSQNGTDEFKSIADMRTNLEKALLDKMYKAKCDSLKTIEPTDENFKYAKKVRALVDNSKCESCRKVTGECLDIFQKRYDQRVRTQALEDAAKVQKAAKDQLMIFLDKKGCIEKNINANTDTGAGYQYAVEQCKVVFQGIDDLKNSWVEKKMADLSLDEILAYKVDLPAKTKSIMDGLDTNCKSHKSLCANCK